MPKIEKGKPLPEHTKLDYYECYAKIILEALFSDRYETLSLADKPDLQNLKKDIGIEVTTAVDSKRREAEKLWYTIANGSPREEARDLLFLFFPGRCGRSCVKNISYPHSRPAAP